MFPHLFTSDADWEYYTEPQPELDDRRLYHPRGKTLGGSSSLNAQIYNRGSPWDYELPSLSSSLGSSGPSSRSSASASSLYRWTFRVPLRGSSSTTKTRRGCA